MLEKEVNHLLLLLHHLLQVNLGWCSQFFIIVCRVIRLWSVFIVIALVVGKGVLVVVNDSASAIGAFSYLPPQQELQESLILW
jgi:hypothetical protein